MQKIATYFVHLLLLYLISGCSSPDRASSQISESFNELAYTPSNKVVAFDQKLAAITDQASAEDAVLHFTSYVESKREIPKDSLVNAKNFKHTGTFSNLIEDETFLKIAAMESSNRVKKSTYQLKKEPNSLISIQKLAAIINSMDRIQSAQTEPISIDELKQNQQLIRETLPHLSSSKDTQMTLLEASILMYVTLTGDNGLSASTQKTLFASNADVNKFYQLLLTH